MKPDPRRDRFRRRRRRCHARRRSRWRTRARRSGRLAAMWPTFFMRRPGFQEREPRLHEHHEDRCHDHPYGARRDREPGSSSDLPPPRVRPVSVVRDGAHGRRPDDPVRPTRCHCERRPRSPRPPSSARSSFTTNVRTAFGRNRDSKIRPRYSCVMPRWRPWPMASTTVTPTWPASLRPRR